jgi:hypothetical protein
LGAEVLAANWNFVKFREVAEDGRPNQCGAIV